MSTPVSEEYVKMIKAFKSDCQDLVKTFQDQKSDGFSNFVPIWKSSKFKLIYEKYNKIGWNNNFKEDTLQIAKYIMLNEHFVGGMYLLFGLYYVQEDPKPSIRLNSLEFEKLTSLLVEERTSLQDTCQPGLMFSKLLKNDAFSFVMYPRDLYIERQKQARLINNDQPIIIQENNTVVATKWCKDFLQHIDIIDDLKKFEENYVKKKKKLKEDYPELNLALDMEPDDIITGIEKSLTEDDTITPQPPPPIGERRLHLKHRKRKIKHRYGEPSTSKSRIKGPPYRRRGAPKGMRKLYFRALVNEPASGEDSYGSDEDDPKLSLPDIL